MKPCPLLNSSSFIQLALGRCSLVLLSILISWPIANAQEEEVDYTDQVFSDRIKSIKFHPLDFPISPPVLPLNGDTRLLLSFDDLDKDAKNYVYMVVHCNADWTPSELMELDYMNTFTEDEIQEYNFSFNTLMPYTHYELELPNDNFQWTISGNYLLKVYDDEGDRKLVFTRRFFVVDPMMIVTANMTPTAQVSNRKTHHEFDFEIIHKDIKINSPSQEIQVVIRQNNRWDNAITDLPPAFIKREEQRLVYNYQNKVLFPASKEFRFLDMRTFRFLGPGIADLVEADNFYEVYIAPDESRAYSPFVSAPDLNGDYVIESLDTDNPEIRGDYAEVMFTLMRNLDYEDADVYVIGGFTDWKLREEFKMVYNPHIPAYVTKGLLKEGFYDYAYAYIEKGSQRFDLSELEGNSFETRNQYSILVISSRFWIW
ncbi:MAG: DUF5103 domain-containing protein, partial [Bacteroidota bacterium]